MGTRTVTFKGTNTFVTCTETRNDTIVRICTVMRIRIRIDIRISKDTGARTHIGTWTDKGKRKSTERRTGMRIDKSNALQNKIYACLRELRINMEITHKYGIYAYVRELRINTGITHKYGIYAYVRDLRNLTVVTQTRNTYKYTYRHGHTAN